MNNPLIGRTVQQVSLTHDKSGIRFDLADGRSIEAFCEADCCSHTWIENVEMPALGLPFRVDAVSDLSLPEDGWHGERDGYIRHYGLCLATDKGHFVIDYRNESNGYYGGNLCWPDDGYRWDVKEDDWIPVE